MDWYKKELFQAGSSNVFVFGSNRAGRHGRGAAKFALDYCGAQYGNPFGPQGQSFAIPTKSENFRTLSLDEIEQYVRQFLYFAKQRQDLTFYITEIGCGLAGLQPIQIAPMFSDAPDNCILPDRFKVKPEPLLLKDDNTNTSTE